MTKEEIANLIDNKYKNGSKFGYREPKAFNKKRGRKIISLLMAGIAFIVTPLSLSSCNKKKSNTDNTETSSVDVEGLNFVSLDSLGDARATLKNDGIYKNPTGNINVDSIISDENGKLWDSKESLDNSKNIGTKVIQDNNENYVVSKDTKTGEDVIIDPKLEYQIVDKSGNVKSEGNLGSNNLPNGYEYDTSYGEIIKSEDVGKYIKSDLTFYSSTGEVIINKGDTISKETYERALKELYTKKPENKITKVSEETILYEDTESTTTSSNDSTLDETTNSFEEISSEETFEQAEGSYVNGFYVVYDMRFLSKEDYLDWINNNYEGYYMNEEGIMKKDKGYEKILKR